MMHGDPADTLLIAAPRATENAIHHGRCPASPEAPKEILQSCVWPGKSPFHHEETYNHLETKKIQLAPWKLRRNLLHSVHLHSNLPGASSVSLAALHHFRGVEHQLPDVLRRMDAGAVGPWQPHRARHQRCGEVHSATLQGRRHGAPRAAAWGQKRPWFETNPPFKSWKYDGKRRFWPSTNFGFGILWEYNCKHTHS